MRVLVVVALLVGLAASAFAERVRVKGRTYVTTRELARGNWAAVHVAEEVGTGRTVAIKIPIANDRGQPDGHTLRLEHRVMNRLGGKKRALPRVLDELGTVEGSGEDALVMEYLDGLHQLPTGMQAGPMIEVMLDLLDAVELMHGEGLWHGDITPRNVALDGDGRVHLLDFGRTRRTAEPRENPPGWPGYHAPEVRDVNARRGDLQDIHAIGAVIKNHTTSPELRAIAAKATQADPTKRHQSVDELRQELLRVRAGLQQGN